MEQFCTICLEEVNENYRTVNDCDHVFCFNCLDNIIFSRDLECPLDFVKIKVVNEFQNKEKESKPILEYLLTMWSSNRKVFVDKVERIWFTCLLIVIDHFNNSQSFLSKYYSLLDKSADESEYTNLLKLFPTFKPITYCPFETNKPLETIFRSDETSIYLVNFRNWHLLSYYITRFNNNMILDDIYTNPNYFPIENKDKIKSEIQIRREAFPLINAIIISYLTQNRLIYEALHFNNQMKNINQCLICLNEVDKNIYGKFATCNHKLCLKCVEKYMIFHGNCPLDSERSEEFNIEIYDNRDSRQKIDITNDYLLENCEKIIDKNIRDLTNDAIEFIDLILNNKQDFFNFVKLLIVQYKKYREVENGKIENVFADFKCNPEISCLEKEYVLFDFKTESMFHSFTGRFSLINSQNTDKIDGMLESSTDFFNDLTLIFWTFSRSLELKFHDAFIFRWDFEFRIKDIFELKKDIENFNKKYDSSFLKENEICQQSMKSLIDFSECVNEILSSDDFIRDKWLNNLI